MEQTTLVKDTPIKAADITVNGLGIFIEPKASRMFLSWEVLDMCRKIAASKPNFHATEPEEPTGVVEWREGGPLPNG